jgi:poly-gamma-glutamate capsule biosynthesis protein CapA/YwtB (metallophosphatase superfamily)
MEKMDAVRFLTGGDVAPIRTEGIGMFGDIAAQFRRADVSFVNLEHALSTKGELVRGKPFYHRGPPLCADGLKEAELSCVNLANNHVLDFGEESLLETFESLRARDIPFFGAGLNLEQARKPCVIEHSGLRVGFLGYTTTLPQGFAASDSRAGVNPVRVYTAYQQQKSVSELPGLAPRILTWTEPADLEGLRHDVKSVAMDVDVLMVYVHWGTSMNPGVHDFQTEIGRAAIEAGAQAVFGGHQHVPSAIEFYQGCPIVHSTGNLLFDKWEPHFTDETLKTFLVGATLEPDRVRDIFLLPVKGGVETPPLMLTRADPLWNEIFRDMEKMCHKFGTELVAREDRIEVKEGK